MIANKNIERIREKFMEQQRNSGTHSLFNNDDNDTTTIPVKRARTNQHQHQQMNHVNIHNNNSSFYDDAMTNPYSVYSHSHHSSKIHIIKNHLTIKSHIMMLVLLTHSVHSLGHSSHHGSSMPIILLQIIKKLDR